MPRITLVQQSCGLLLAIALGPLSSLAGGCDAPACPSNSIKVGDDCVSRADEGTRDSGPDDATSSSNDTGPNSSGTSGTATNAVGASGTASSAESGSSGAADESPRGGSGGDGGRSSPGSTAGASMPTAGVSGDGSESGTGGSSAGSDASPPTCAPQSESCDNQDNDCDGMVDEGVTRTCGLNVGICKPGSLSCRAGVWDDEQTRCQGGVAPQEEICETAGLDENCNGIPNEQCQCADGATMPCGSTNPPCRPGRLTCRNGSWPTECPDDIEGSAETCDGVDNDCDGTADDGGDALCSSGRRCAGSLKCVECTSDTDCSGRSAATCKFWRCNLSTHACQQADSPARTPCNGNQVCSAGACVGCIDAGDCARGQECAMSSCRKKPVCGDGEIDPGEGCDDGNTDSNDFCTSECKRNECGDRHWNKASGAEACDVGDRSDFADGRVWDKWSCDSNCRRVYTYTPCTTDQSCGTAFCAGNRNGLTVGCMASCSGPLTPISTCRDTTGKAGYCVGGLCTLACNTNSADCPPGSTCTVSATPDANGNTFSVCAPRR